MIKCPECGKQVSDQSETCIHCGFPIKKGNVIHCPRCKSTNITTGERGYSIWTGFLGAGQTVNRCADCGYKWKPTNKR